MAVTKHKKPIRHATTRAVEKQVLEWDAPVVKCRSWAHGWDPHTALTVPSGRGAEIQQCSRCGAFRHRILAASGAVVEPWTSKLPKGYPVPRGFGRITGAAMNPVRRAALQGVTRRQVPDTLLHETIREIEGG